MTAIDEAQARAMRDNVYGIPSSDKNWIGCRDFWMKGTELTWLWITLNTPLPKASDKHYQE